MSAAPAEKPARTPPVMVHSDRCAFIGLTTGETAIVDASLADRQLIYFHRTAGEIPVVIRSRAWSSYGVDARWRYVRGQMCHDTKRVVFFLHRLVIGARPGQLVDHVDGNRLDNRRCNLRFATNAENIRNMAVRPDRGQSRFKGVAYRREDGLWRSQIGYQGRRLNLGNFPSEALAAGVYDVAALTLFGRFARLNCPSLSEADRRVLAHLAIQRQVQSFATKIGARAA